MRYCDKFWSLGMWSFNLTEKLANDFSCYTDKFSLIAGPETWAMAAGKTDVLLLLLNKLMEDGNILYKVSINYIIIL